MRFERVRIDAFGGLRDLDTGPEPLRGLVVVHGPNEAGKSTFFQFLTALLYGFYPATREAHPLAPWDGADPSGGAILRSGGGGAVEVERRLLSSPSGGLLRDGRREELRNRTLPWVEHVPLSVFRQVYALTQAELTALEGESWARVQDRLLTGMGARDLGSVRDAVARLEREAGRLWRPNQRGNQEVRDLRERIRELKLRRRAAADADRRLREAHREATEVRGLLQKEREEREACRLYLDRYRALLPIRDQLERIRGLEEEAGPPGELEGLPADPVARLRELAEAGRELTGRLEELDRRAEELRERLGSVGPTQRALLDAGDEIRRVVGRVHGLEPVAVRAGQVEQSLRDVERRATMLAAELLDARLEGLSEEELERVDPSAVAEACDTLRRAEQARAATEDAAPAPGSEASDGSGSLPARGLLVLAAGGTLAAAGLALGRTAWAALGAVLACVGAAWIGVRWGVARSRAGDAARERELARRRVEEARERERVAREALDERLRGAPIRGEVRSRPPADLGQRLGRLRELMADARDRRETLAGLRRSVSEVEAALRELGERTGMTLPANAAAAAHEMDEALRAAERSREAARAAVEERDRLDRERTTVVERLEARRADRDALEARLGALADGDPERGARRAVERLRAADRARQRTEELRREHPDLDEIRRRIADAEAGGEDWVVDDRALARRRAEEEGHTHRVEELTRRLEGLQKDVEYLGREDRVDRVDGQIESLERELAAAARRRDRLWVLAALLREADRRFREEHQPDVLRRAGELLCRVTGGRYDRVLVGDAGVAGRQPSETFLLRGSAARTPVALDEPLSTGTREQAYLALRVAVLDHLDRDGERLPLFLDEAFVNWDPERRGRVLDLLREISGERQVFVFTCHPSLAAALTEHGAGRIDLARAD